MIFSLFLTRAESARARETDEEDPNSPRGLTIFGKVSNIGFTY